MYYVYVLRKNDSDLYVGYTEDLKRRFKQHQRKEGVKLIYYEAYPSRKKAMMREKRLEYHGSAWRALKKRIMA